MTTSKREVIGIGVLFIVLSFIIYLFAGWVFPQIFGIEAFSSPTAYIFIVLFGAIVIISAFLPYGVGKFARIIAYFLLFVSLLIVEVNILKHFVKRVDVNIESCQNIFFPQSSANNIVYDALSYVSCIFTGYVPQNQTIIGWSTFILFYIILPFAFIWTFIHGLMKEIMGNWFQQTPHVISILSFITAIYATRTLFGAFLLTFFGYGAWGLAGIFIAILLVRGLEKLIEDKFKIEEYASEIRKTLEIEKSTRRLFASAAIGYVNNAFTINDFNREGMLWGVSQIEGITTMDLWKSLSDTDRRMIRDLILQIRNAAMNENRNEYINKVDKLRKLLMNWIKSK